LKNTEIVEICPDNPQIERIERASEVLKKGGLVIFPTETVYGLGADSTNPQAVERIYEVKRRPLNKPLALHIADRNEVERLVDAPPALFYTLSQAFWPGPLTLILKAKEGKVGFRFPDNKIAQALIKRAGVLSATSANLSGSPPPFSLADAIKELNGKVELAIDGGKSRIGAPSTVLDLSSFPVKVIREGVISAERIRRLVRRKRVLFVCTGNTCRSVMAEGLLKKALKERKMEEIEVNSAGVFAFPETSPTKETIQVLRKEGIDVSDYRAKRLSSEMIKSADLIFVMQDYHRDILLRYVPWAKERIFVLDIPDPIGKPFNVYQEYFEKIKKHLPRILASIKELESSNREMD